MAACIRWMSGLVSRVDAMIAQVENHDAIAESAIRTVQRSVGRARVHLGRVQADGRTLRERLASEQERAETWRDRARREKDDERALECLRRGKQAHDLARSLEHRSAEHEQTERQLATDLARLEERLRQIREERNKLRTRQSRAEAIAAVHGADSGLDGQIDDVFERWELRLAETEILGEPGNESVDAFERELTRAEEDAALRAELEELRRAR